MRIRTTASADAVRSKLSQRSITDAPCRDE
jgi:hypothetical protein